MKLTDYVIQFLADQKIDRVFGLTGGAVLHLFDSADKHPGIEPIFCHHEQAAALAAVSYARFKEGLGAAIVTTGPGGTNAVTGVLAAWQDSIPCFFISGQARMEQTSRGKPVRQLGAQEFDIVSIVEPMTKYAVLVERPERIRYHLEKALYLACSGRPGPVWIDIPLNFQWMDIDPSALEGFKPSGDAQEKASAGALLKGVKECRELLAKARRPLILAGYGIRLAHAGGMFRQWVEGLNVPFISTWTASDLLPTAHPLYTGRLGMTGQRGGNLAVQNCDLLICVGSHLSIPLTTGLFDAFAREAKIVLVDIDKDSLDNRTVRADLCIVSDVKEFLGKMRAVSQIPRQEWSSWRRKCQSYKKYNAVPEAARQQKKYVNSNYFVDVLSEMLDPGDVIVVDGGGTNLYTSFQSFKVKRKQRLLLSSGICSMGTGLPESVGACFAHDRQRTVCLSGDGSMQFNIHELQTIVHHRLPVKIFVINNDGYLAIRHTQSAFLKKNYVGSGRAGGVSLPDMLKVAKAYGLRTVRIRHHGEMSEKIASALQGDDPVVCEVMVAPDQGLIVQQGFDVNSDGTFSPRPLEDMYPYMDREELRKNLIVGPWVRPAK